MDSMASRTTGADPHVSSSKVAGIEELNPLPSVLHESASAEPCRVLTRSPTQQAGLNPALHFQMAFSALP